MDRVSPINSLNRTSTISPNISPNVSSNISSAPYRNARRAKAIGWAFALLFAWLLSMVVAKPVAAQTDISPSTPCLTSRNLTNLSSGSNRGITNQPVISGNGARVAFWSVNSLGGGNVDGNIEVFVRETANNNVVQLTDSVGSILGGFNLEPSINTAGTRIAFYSDRDLVEGQNQDGNFEIFLARRANNGTWSITQITDTQGSANLFPSINAAGNRIAFVSDDSELHNIDDSRVNAERNFEIFLAVIPNSGAVQFRQITNTGVGVTNDQPVINAAGSRIAFTAATGQTAQVFVWDESQSSPAQLTQTDTNDQPSISADGTNIVYIATTADDRSRVVMHTLSEDNSESSAEVIVPTATNTKYRGPSISGNGKRVVYVAEQSVGGAVQINVMLYDVDTGLGVPISEVGGGTGEQPAISTDGTRVTFVGVQAIGGATDNSGSDIYINECPQADLVLSFVEPPIESVLAGIDVAYTFNVTNRGPSPATGVFFHADLASLPALPANVTRVLPAGCTVDANDFFCPLGNLAVNASRVFSFGYDIPSNAGLTNIVSAIDVGANAVDSNDADNSSGQFTTRIFEEAALTLQVTTDIASVLAGSPQELSYDLRVTNAGPSQARSARITNTLPTGASFVSVQLIQGGGVGASCSAPVGKILSCDLGDLTTGNITVVRIKVTADASASSSLINVATVRSLTAESNLANNTVTTQTPVVRVADMAITKEVSPTTVIAGRELTYTLTFTNNGFADTVNATVIDTLPPNVTYVRSTVPSGASCTPSGGGQIVTCNFPGAMLVNTSRTLTLTALVQSVAPAGLITNTARVLSGRTDPDASNDETPPVQTEVTLLADLAVSKSVNTTLPDIGKNFTYTVKLRNNGPSQAYNVVVTDMLPSGLTFISSSATRGSYSSGTGLWTVGTLPVAAVGQESTLTIVARAQDSAGGVAKINTASASGSQPEPDAGLPSSASVTIVPQRADIQVSKSSSPNIATHVVAGKLLTYTVTITNAGPTAARSVVLTDVLPANVFLVSASAPSGRTACVTGTTITCNVGNMITGTVLNYTVVVTRELKGLITNTVSASSSTPDIVPGNNSASHSIIVDPDVPKRLVFTQQPPSGATAGQVFGTIPTVELRDKFDNLVDTTTASTDNIRLTAYTNVGSCINLGDSSGLTPRTVSAVGGVATFTGLTDTKSHTIRLLAEDTTSGGVTAACSNAITVNADSVSALYFTTPPRTLIAGDLLPSQVITVERRDQFNNVNTDGDFSVQLSEDSPSTNTFVDTTGSGATTITSVLIPDGSAAASFFYTDTVIGTYNITASAPSITVTPAVQTITVNAAPAQELLVVVSGPTTTTAGVSSDLFTVQRVDRFNNPNDSDPDVTVNLTTDPFSVNGLFRNITDTQTVTQAVIPIGSSTTEFRYQDTLAGTQVISITDANTGSGQLKGDTVDITVVPSTTYRLLITSTPQIVVAGEVSDPLRVTREDFFGNANFEDDALQVDLTSSSGGAPEFRATELGAAVPSVTIPKGSNFTDFYYTDELAATFTLTTSATGKVADSQAITVVAAVPQQLAILTTTTVITAGAPPFPVTIQRQDQFANPASNAGPLEIFLVKQSPQGKFFEIGSSTEITKVTISVTDASFRYQDLQQGNWQLTYTDNAVTNFDVTQPITVTAAEAAKLLYLQKPITMTAGVRSSIFEVQRRDTYDNPYTGPDPLTVNLTTTSAGLSKFINGIDNTTVVTNMVIAGGTSTTTFYYDDSYSGVHLITADDAGALTPATTLLTVESASGYKTVFIAEPLSATAGITSGLFTVQVQDQFSNPVTPSIGSPVVVNLTSSLTPTARFVNAANNATITSISIGGSSFASFRYYSEKAGSPSITADDVGTLLADFSIITINPAPANHIVFTTSPLTLTAGVTSTLVTVQRLDQFNNPNLNEPARTLNLTENSPGNARFIHASSNTTLTSVDIPNGSSTASFRYYDDRRGTFQISVASSGLTTINQPYKILGAAATRLKLLTVPPSASQTAGITATLTITAFDQFGNLSDPYTGTKIITFTGAGPAPDGTLPTVTNASGAPVAFGTGVTLTFSAGGMTAGGKMILYDAAGSVTIAASDSNGIAAAGGDRLVALTVVANALYKVQAETPTGGAEVAVIVPTQTITAGHSIQLFSVGRDIYGNSRGNIASATWVMTKTGGVVDGDLVAGSGSATFTGDAAGTAIVEPRAPGAIPVASGTLTVVAGDDAVVRVETKPDGTGSLVATQSLTAGSAITVYAVVRDALGNFKGNLPANWEIINGTGGVNTATNLAPVIASPYTVFTAKQIGSGKIRANVGVLSRVDSGTITVVFGPAARFGVAIESGATSVNVNETQTFIMTAYDAYTNVVTTYVGFHTLYFSGAQPSRAPVIQPYVINRLQQVKNFGEATELEFLSGVSRTNGSRGDFKLFHAPYPDAPVVISVTDNSITGTKSINVVRGSQNRIAISAASGTISAGASVPLTMTIEDAYGNRVPTFSGTKQLIFSGSPDPNQSGFPATVSRDNPPGNDIAFGADTQIEFADGESLTISSFNGVMKLYKTGVFNVSVQEKPSSLPSGVNGSKTFTVTPSNSQAMTLDLAATQNNRTPFAGVNTLTLKDIYGNLVPAQAVTITTSLPGSVIIAGSGNDNVLENELAATGTVNLSAGGLGLRYEGVANATAVFTATTAPPSGGTLVATDSVIMNAGPLARLQIQGQTTTDPLANTLTVTAGQRISLTTRLYDVDGNLATNATSPQPLIFTLSPNPSPAVTVTNNSGSPITINGSNSANFDFASGVSSVASDGDNGRLHFGTVGTYTLTATSGVSVTTQAGHALVVTVVPGPANALQMSLQDGQVNDVPFTGTNRITVTDQFNNPISSFGADGERITLTVTSPTTGTVALPSSATGQPVLTGPDFTGNVADLTALGLKYTGLTTATVTIRARLQKASGATADFTDNVTVAAGSADHFALAVTDTPLPAGSSLTTTLTAYDVSGNLASSTTSQVITFTGAMTATDGTGPLVNQGSDVPFNQGTTINFTAGVADLDIKLFKAGVNSVYAKQGNAQVSNIEAVTVLTGSVAAFIVEIASPQILTNTLSSPAVITATDAFSNVVTSFDASATNVQATFLQQPSCGALTPVIADLGSGNTDTLDRNTDFTNGVANLIANGNLMKVNSGCTGVYQFRFTAGAATGDSGLITFNDPP